MIISSGFCYKIAAQGRKRERERRKHFCVLPFFVSLSFSLSLSLFLSLSLSLSLYLPFSLHSKSLLIIAVHQSQGVNSLQESLSYLVPFMMIGTVSMHWRFYVEINKKKIIFYTLCTRFPSGGNKCREVWAPRMIRFDNLIVIIWSNRPALLFRTQCLRNSWSQCFPDIFAPWPLLG